MISPILWVCNVLHIQCPQLSVIFPEAFLVQILNERDYFSNSSFQTRPHMSCRGRWLVSGLPINSCPHLGQSFATRRVTVTWSTVSLAGAMLGTCSPRGRCRLSLHSQTDIIPRSLGWSSRDHLGPMVQWSMIWGQESFHVQASFQTIQTFHNHCFFAGPHFKPDQSL